MMLMMIMLWRRYEGLVRKVRPDQATCHDTAHQRVPRHGQPASQPWRQPAGLAMAYEIVQTLSSQRRELNYKSGLQIWS